MDTFKTRIPANTPSQPLTAMLESIKNKDLLAEAKAVIMAQIANYTQEHVPIYIYINNLYLY